MRPPLRPFLISILIATAAAAQQPQPTLEERITTAAAGNRYRLAFDGTRFSGEAWTRLLDEGRGSHFFLLGEEHGIAENARLAAALFHALHPAGYSKFAIEVSPAMAGQLDRAARDGVPGLRTLYSLPGGEPAFFGMKEEAEMLAAIRATSKGSTPVLWGVDYEVGGDRLLISLLEKKRMPAAARSALAKLKAASDNSWSQYAQTRNPEFIYSFSGDPALVEAVREKWPNPDPESASILETLERTFAINKLWMTGKRFESNEQRSAFFRRNFLRHWQTEKRAGRSPKVFLKLGASHLVRGRNFAEAWDLGALLPEIAAVEGSKAFHLLVLPGTGSKTAVFDPAAWTYKAAAAKDGYERGLEPILSAAFPDAFTLIDLRALRPVVAGNSKASPELMRTVHGFDALLVMSGSTASANLRD